MTMRTADRGLRWSDVIRLAIEARLAFVHVAFPARVERYDAARNVVDVQPQLEAETECLDGSSLRERLPVIPSVPIAFQRTKAFGVTFPIAVGDFVLVVCCDRNIGEWMRTGQAGDPHDAGVHVLDGAVAIPGLYPDAHALDGEVLTDHLVLGSLDGGPTIHVDDSEIRLGSDSASERAVLGSSQQSALDTFLLALKLWANAVNTGVSAAGGAVADHPAFVTAIEQLQADLVSALSAKVRVE